MSKIDEKELHVIFNGIKSGDESSFTSLYENYYNLVYRIVFSILKNKENSEDVTQIVFSKIYQLPKEKLPESYEASWLYKVSKNETLQYLRKAKNELNIDEIYDISEQKNNIDEIIDVETYKKMIQGLSETEKEIISLKILSQFTFKRIGQMLKMPTGTVKWNYYKAVSSLKISLSSLAGFIITFVLGISTMFRKEQVNFSENKEVNKSDNEYISQNEDYSEEAKTEFDSQTTIDSTNKGENSSLSDSTSDKQSTIQTVGTKTEDVYHINYISLGFCGISLIFFIIFVIFFKKYQLKRKVRASKN